MAIHVLSAATNRLGPRKTNRIGHRKLLLGAIAVLVGLLASCGESGSDAEDATTDTTVASDDTATPEESTATSDGASADAPTTEADDDTDAGTGGPPDLDQLREAIDATIARDTARFSMDVTQTLPVTGPNQASMRRTGSFDDGIRVGTGTQQFLGQTSAAADFPGYAGEEIEHRVVDGTYWLLNPVSDPPTWIGYELTALNELSAGDPTAAVDGDVYLRTVRDALTSVTDVVEFDDGSQGWAVQATADDLLPLVVTAGVQERLDGAGLEPTDLETTISLAVDPEGMVIGFIAELNEWWQAVIEQTVGATDSPAGMVFQFQMSDFDATVEVESPCSNPEELLEPDAPPALICEG